jgi:DNA-binding response OmpR family regulator
MTVRVLFVDDNDLFRRTAKEELERRGLSVMALACGRDAIELAQVATFDVLLVDLGLPDVCGLDIIRQVRQRDRKVGIVVLTCWDNAEATEMVKDWGVARVLSKPTTIKEIEAVLQDIGSLTAHQDALVNDLRVGCRHLGSARQKFDRTTDFLKRKR